MNYQTYQIFLSCVIIASCVNWSEQNSTVEGRRKQAINFSGTLVTQQGDTLSVENISIGHLYKQIPVYEMPMKRNEQYTLDKNPKNGIITRIDLAEIEKILIPHPDIIWKFESKERSRKIEYIQIIVISNDPEKTQHNYLIDLERKVICDEVNPAGPIEKDIPLPAIKQLVISGFKARETDQRRASCPPCPVQQAR